MSRAPSTGAGSSYASNSVRLLAVAPVPETPRIASLDASSADDSDEAVQISLGIQQGIAQAWGAALEKLGSLSLAWQSEVASAQGSLTQAVDPALIFDGVSKPAGAVLALGQPNRPPKPGSHAYRARKQKETAAPLSIIPIAPAWHMKGPPSIILEGATAERAGLDVRKLDDPLHKPPARRSPGGATPSTMKVPLDAKASRKVSGHRLSIKLERLLPPRSPDSGAMTLHTPILVTRSARGRPRRCSALSDQAPSRRRARSQPQPATIGGSFGRQRDILDLTASVGRVSAQRIRASPLPSDMEDINLLPDEQRLEMLEAQVSGMFCELGLRSPYIQSSCLVEQRTLTGAVHRGPEQAPWFYRKEYAEHGPPQERPVRHIILVDDDSSCPDNAACSVHHRHSCSSCHRGEAAQMSCQSQRTRRLATSASALSVVNESTGSTAVGSSHDPTCYQVHSLQQRIDQADQYIHSVSRHASAIGKMLADLRKQSQALAEALTTSQARAAPCPSQFDCDSGLPARKLKSQHKRANKAGGLGASPMLGESPATTPPAPRFCSLPRREGSQSVAAVVPRSGSASCSEGTDEDLSIRRRSKSQLQRHIGDWHLERPDRGLEQIKRSQSHRRRPVQPVSVRLQRIGAQWGELCEMIAALGIDTPATDNDVAARELTLRRTATGIAVGGLKSIQRALRNTLESLNALGVGHASVRSL